MLSETSREVGINLAVSSAVERIEKGANGFYVYASSDGHTKKFEAELVVHGAGRIPDIDDLELERAHIKRERKGVVVNEYLQSVTNPRVYAAGDAAVSGGFPLTPVAGLEGAVAAKNLLDKNHATLNYLGVPSVVFTLPPLAAVGLSEEIAQKQGLKFRVNHADTSEWYSSRRLNLRPTGYKVLIEEGSGKILGAHLFGAHAEEVINVFALAIRKGFPASELREIPWAYPTSFSDVAYMV